MRLIDADALKEKLQEHHDFIINAWKENGVAPIYIPVPDKSRLDEIINSIAEVVNAPTIEERPKGKWYYNYQNGWHCSMCNKSVKDMPTVMGKADFNFCPNYGARMESDV